MFDGSIPSKPKTWTPEQLEELVRLVGEGLTYSVIAAQMGITRNAAIGKAGRFRIKNGHPPRQPKAGVANPGPRKKRQAHPLKGRKTMRFAQDAINARLRIAPSPIPPQPPPEGSRTFAEMVGGMCRHPYGSQLPYTFCGLPIAFDGSSYCPAHRATNYIPFIPSTARVIWRGC